MSAILEVREADARYLDALQPPVIRQFESVATARNGVERLRELIVRLAIRGRLVPQARASKKLAAPRRSFFEDGEPFDIPPGWRWVRLGDLVVSSEAGWSPNCHDMPRVGERWAVLKVSAVSWGKFNPEANKELPPGLSPRPEYEVKPGDFLLSRANTADLVARSVVVGTTPAHLMLSDKTIRLNFASDTNPEFINLVNNSGQARAYYARHASGTSSSMKNVSRAVILGLPIALPPVTEQDRIVARVDELMRLCDDLEAKGRLEAEQHAHLLSALLGALTTSRSPEELAANWQRVASHFDLLLDRPEALAPLEQTIMDLAVRGMLVPQNLSDEPAALLVDRICDEKGQLIRDGKLRTDKSYEPITKKEQFFELPRGWTWVRFGKITINRDGERVPVSSGDRERRSKVYDYYGASGVIDKIDDFLFDKTLLLIGEDGANLLNRSSPIAFLAHGKYWVNNHAHVIDTTEAGVMQYLELFINAISLEAYVTGTAQPKMNQAKLNSIVVPLPPLAEQARIVARVTHLRRLCADLRERLATSQGIQSRLADALVESATAA